MTHKQEFPHKVEAIKKYLAQAFPGHETRQFFEPGRSLQSFRIEGTDFGLISLGEEYFFDLPDDEERIFQRLTEARLPHAIRESNSNTRIVLIWDVEYPGHPKIVPETLDPTRKPRK